MASNKKKEVPFRFETRSIPIDELIRKLREEKELEKKRKEELRKKLEAIRKEREIEKEELERKRREEIKKKIEAILKERELQEKAAKEAVLKKIAEIKKTKLTLVEESLLYEKVDDWTIRARISPVPHLVLIHPRKGGVVIPEAELKEALKDIRYVKKYTIIPNYALPRIKKLLERIEPLIK